VLDAEQIDLPKEGNRIISTTAGKRHTIVTNSGGRTYICAEPPPDAATSADLTVDFNLTLVNLGGSERGDDDQDLEQEGLGGRSANVLMVRDLLYRTCELFINSSLTDDQKLSVFRDVLRTIERVGSAKVNQGTTPGERHAVTFPSSATSAAGGTSDKTGQASSAGGDDQSDQKGPPQSCASSPEGTECGGYCSQNAGTTMCAALCAASGDYYGWCKN
jgi:hypothetical protein